MDTCATVEICDLISVSDPSKRHERERHKTVRRKAKPLRKGT